MELRVGMIERHTCIASIAKSKDWIQRECKSYTLIESASVWNVVDDGWGGKADSQSISRGDLLLMSINVFQI